MNESLSTWMLLHFAPNSTLFTSWPHIRLADAHYPVLDTLARIVVLEVGLLLAVHYFDGISFAPTLLGKGKQAEHDFLYWEFNETDQIAVRQGDWKLIVKKGVPHLYNLATDLHEDVDLASKYPEQVEKMKEIIFREHTHSPDRNVGFR